MKTPPPPWPLPPPTGWWRWAPGVHVLFNYQRDWLASDIVAGLVEQLRLVKDTDELATIARACAITVAAFEAISEEIRVGQAEVLVARRLEQLFGELGAEDVRFSEGVDPGA